MTRGLFSSHTSECTHPRYLPCSQGGISNGAGDVEGRGCKTELCSMSLNGEGVEIVKCEGVGEVKLLNSVGAGSRVIVVG